MVMQAANIMNDLVPITRFNKGEAGKIFDEVNKKGTCIVVKNNKPACVLISPERYEFLIEQISDKLLFEEEERRMSNWNASSDITHEELMKEMGITEADLNDVDVDIE